MPALLIALLLPAAAAAGDRPSTDADRQHRIAGRVDLFANGRVAHVRLEPAEARPARRDRRTAAPEPLPAQGAAGPFIAPRFSRDGP